MTTIRRVKKMGAGGPEWETVEVTTILGHQFAPMTKNDYYGFAGAGDNALICHLPDGTTLIAELVGGGDTEADNIWTIAEINPEGQQRDWRGTPL